MMELYYYVFNIIYNILVYSCFFYPEPYHFY